ncbi:MAG: hypothetical protein JRE27_01400 [Deltaproteobacteria bacterium]|nr:hypothetical protein [Deltaproteobacteria bacterium]
MCELKYIWGWVRFFTPKMVRDKGVVNVKDHAFFYRSHTDGWVSDTVVNHTDLGSL